MSMSNNKVVLLVIILLVIIAIYMLNKKKENFSCCDVMPGYETGNTENGRTHCYNHHMQRQFWCNSKL